ncbi:SCO3374 family protein [Streptomyces sp. NPDC057245]|uniref:SCO3374 family protein n=1 Tax=Streptomyces sp. NPDC057245 TaxID=3346065 RepID=UPI003639D665
MSGPPPPVPAAAAPVAPVPVAPAVPSPRRPPGAGGAWGADAPSPSGDTSFPCPSGEGVRRWYERVLGWPTAPGLPVRLRVGVRFDVLDVPADAGRATLTRLGRSGAAAARWSRMPVAVRGGRMQLLVAAGGAEELPGLLEWLEWGSLPLGLTAVGAGGLMTAPPPAAATAGSYAPAPDAADLRTATPGAADSGAAGPRTASPGGPPDSGAAAPGAVVPRVRAPGGLRGAACWLRPPEPGSEAEASLPALSALGGVGDAPDLAQLVRTLATQCHRVRLGAVACS